MAIRNKSTVQCHNLISNSLIFYFQYQYLLQRIKLTDTILCLQTLSYKNIKIVILTNPLPMQLCLKLQMRFIRQTQFELVIEFLTILIQRKLFLRTVLYTCQNTTFLMLFLLEIGAEFKKRSGVCTDSTDNPHF